MDRIREEFIKGTAHARCFGGEAGEGRLRRCGPVQRRDSRRVMRMDLPGRRTRCRWRGEGVRWCERRMQMTEKTEEEDPLCRPLRGKAERRGSNWEFQAFINILQKEIQLRLWNFPFRMFILFSASSLSVFQILSLRLLTGHSGHLQIVYWDILLDVDQSPKSTFPLPDNSRSASRTHSLSPSLFHRSSCRLGSQPRPLGKHTASLGSARVSPDHTGTVCKHRYRNLLRLPLHCPLSCEHGATWAPSLWPKVGCFLTVQVEKQNH